MILIKEGTRSTPAFFSSIYLQKMETGPKALGCVGPDLINLIHYWL